MVYSLEEKEKIDELLQAFSSYIAQCEGFDILYSYKVGYVQIFIQANCNNEYIKISSVNQLMDIILEEVFYGWCNQEESNKDEYLKNIVSTIENTGESARQCVALLRERIRDA